ncbi:MAG: DMT family transporter, partial [Candidatus Levybacteria bacterium]|nr:DMT family transporter [Candidatus Levybacteria bacterium]
FLANSASEKIGHNKAFFWSQIAGLALIVVMLFLIPSSFAISPLLVGLTLFCGMAYALGYLLFYKGFEIGNVSVISAVVNLQVLFIILISLFLRGQTLTMLQIPAIILLLFGVTLVSVNLDELRHGTVSLLQGVKETLAASVMFGVFYWPLNEYIVEKADWLAIGLITKFTAIVVVFLITILRKQSLLIQKRTNRLYGLIAAVGILEAIGVLSVTFGQSYGDGIIVAPISSALTIVTVGLAMLFSKERISKAQGVGIALAVS